MTHSTKKPSRIIAPHINDMLTHVVCDRKTLTVRVDDRYNYDIQWDYTKDEPVLIEPGTTAITVRGITPIYQWLKKQKNVTDWFTEDND